MTLLVPEDLKESHAYFVDKMLNHVSVSTDGLYMVQLFERIGRVEHERNQLRATRLEDALTIANQRTLLDKYDANNTALMAREGELNSQVVRLIADKQDLIERNNILMEQAEPRNVIVRCSYCEEQICKESEWVPKVVEHMAVCAKNPVIKMAAGNEGVDMKPEFIFRVSGEDSFKYCFGINIAFDKTGFIFEAMFFLWDFQFNWLKDNFYKEQG